MGKKQRANKNKKKNGKGNGNGNGNGGEEDFSEVLKLWICLEPQDDVPHPRHLCFFCPISIYCDHHFCPKCYCYVCEIIPPCILWDVGHTGHCHATAEVDVWNQERELRKKIRSIYTTMALHKLTVCFERRPDEPEVISGFVGVLICDASGDWVAGLSVLLQDDIGIQDSSALPYRALLEGLQLAWSRGLRYLQIKLGFQYHDGFWYDFDKDAESGEFYLAVDEADDESRVWTILREVESYLARDWFIDVSNTSSFAEESDATAVAVIARYKPCKQVYDFPSDPHTKIIKDLAQCTKSNPEYLKGNPTSSDDLKIYTGLEQ